MTDGEDRKRITIGYQDDGREPTVSDLYDIDTTEVAEWPYEIDRSDINQDSSGVSVNLGEEYHRMKVSSSLWEYLEESGISKEDVDVVYTETRRFGFAESGVAELFSKVYETQKSPEPGEKQEVNPDFIVVPTPVKQKEGIESTKEDVLTHLKEVQKKIENHSDEIEFDGEILLENRDGSHLQGMSDVRELDEIGGEDLRYSVNISEDGGWEMIKKLSPGRIGHIEVPDYDFENFEGFSKDQVQL